MSSCVRDLRMHVCLLYMRVCVRLLLFHSLRTHLQVSVRFANGVCVCDEIMVHASLVPETGAQLSISGLSSKRAVSKRDKFPANAPSLAARTVQRARGRNEIRKGAEGKGWVEQVAMFRRPLSPFAHDDSK